jgi:hypothetical protein
MPTITIERADQYADMYRAYNVRVDRKTVARVVSGGKVSFDVKPGGHELELTIDWCRSNKLKFIAGDNEELHFKCGNPLTGYRIILSWLYITFLRHKYLWLKQV